MPRQQQSFTITSPNKETTLAICYNSFRQLNWDILFAGEDKLLAGTPPVWKSKGQQVMVEATGEQLIISSEMVNDEVFDLGGKNKKNIAAFWNAFEKCRQTITETEIIDTTAAIEVLKAKTMDIAEQEAKEAAEIDAAMNLSKSNLYVTYAIIAVNVLVFVLMAINGAGIFETNGLVHIKWGSNFGPLTLSGDWWRLITSVFIHFGIIHLLMNMYSLYMVGIYLEPMLGKIKYAAAYLCTGVFGSIVSVWWHKDPANSAGASGAIFGMYGLFLALLTTNLIPKKIRQGLLQSIGIFVVYNLIYGVKGGVDNSAHVGGLVSGFVIGYIYAYSIKQEKANQKLSWIVPAVVVLTAAAAFTYLQQNKADTGARNAILNEVNAADYKDNDRFNKRIEEFAANEEKAIAVLNNTDSISRSEYAQRLKDALSFWDIAENALKATSGYTISEASHKKADRLTAYVQLRKEEFNYLISLYSLPTDDEAITQKLEEVEIKLTKLLEELKTL